MRRRWVSSRHLAPLALGLTALLIWAVALAPGPDRDPPLLYDRAQLIAPAQREQLARHHTYLRRDHDIDYRVQTAGDVGDINRFAVERFAALRVGSASGAGRGLLLVIDPVRDRVRLEVGQALEGVFPDAFIAYLEHRQMVPFFREGRVADGILATTELIVTRVQNAQARAALEGEIRLPGSGGGGATTRARLGAGRDPRQRQGGGPVAAGSDPAATLAAYFRAMDERNADPTLAVYSRETREMLARWTVTSAQMDNVLRTYRQCHPEPARLDPEGAHAVIRYPVAERRCAPWFLTRENGRWRLDLVTSQYAIRFGRSNAWRLASDLPRPYGFAFRDWRFDANGFPLAGLPR
ncbi:MAG: TPM domain-containing protein [Gammaproteobacteria bacterium]|nr:TPM domain-containing protein [Gammaproteobacteria bacterium]NIR84824.1 TPM domain-containing protein [Gammaproteobacteria bacterium]NIR91538.1 TPM domain-containing protein [Gammaproteobacteria bacterium]NIU05871.1 TPM domain-containing protein [Gammaproteobacteria bacterium]NIV76726.1 hypothetical protein [Gammaproteobacteria bacterium]